MNIDDVKEWIEIADNDFNSAILLNEAVRKHHEIICYHCSQAVEKYLKGYLIYMDIEPKKTHDLVFLYNACKEKDNEFQSIKTICEFLNRFANDIRYPYRYETKEDDVNFCINVVKKSEILNQLLIYGKVNILV